MDFITHFFLLFSQLTPVICILLAGFFLINPKLFYHTSCIICVSIIINVALKHTFQVPLLPNIHHPGFAFPSGHMQLATVLYGFLCVRFKKPGIYLATAVLLAGIGFSLVYCGYHTWFDVFGGMLTGGLIVYLYQLPWIQNTSIFILQNLVIASAAVIYIGYISHMPNYAWFSFNVLCILSMATRIKTFNHKRN